MNVHPEVSPHSLLANTRTNVLNTAFQFVIRKTILLFDTTVTYASETAKLNNSIIKHTEIRTLTRISCSNSGRKLAGVRYGLARFELLIPVLLTLESSEM